MQLCLYEACANDFSGALFWNSSRTNLLVTQPCSELHPSFRSGVQIGRKCNNDGNWSSVDMTNCTMFLNSNSIIIVYFTVFVTNSNMVDSATIINNVRIFNLINLHILYSGYYQWHLNLPNYWKIAVNGCLIWQNDLLLCCLYCIYVISNDELNSKIWWIRDNVKLSN